MKFVIDSAAEKARHEQKPLESCSSYEMSVDIGEENTGGEAVNHWSDIKYLEPFIDNDFINPLTKDKPVVEAKKDEI